MKYIIKIIKLGYLVFFRALDRVYPYIYKYIDGLTLEGNIRFWGKPIIDIRNGGKIIIVKKTQLISTNIGTHVNYPGPVKLFADKPGSVIKIGDNCSIGGACIHAYKSITIGDNCIIGSGTNIFDANGHPVKLHKYSDRRINVDDSKPIVIMKNVWITLNCVVLPGATIGEGCIVSPNSVVSGEIEPYCIIAGNPACIVKKMNVQ